jgi:DNA mismatch endonuclease (patch repair protein)
MPDFLTPEERSKRMSLIKGKGTKPEKAMRRLLSSAKIKFKSNFRGLPGTPDFVVQARKLIIFVDGEFWHGNGVELMALSPFWRNKINNNQ